jgi:uncharacterized caspase-like protein
MHCSYCPDRGLTEPLVAQAAAQKRVALVIGIGDYQDWLLGKLDHPRPDAEALAHKLSDLDFEVAKELDRTKRQLLTDLDAFVKGHQGSDRILVYFSGHGVQIGGRNYLLPTDANFDTATELQNSSVALDEIFAPADKVAPHRIILLDACRDDPTQRAPRGDPALPIVSGLGRAGRHDGTIYAFSTAPGADGGGRPRGSQSVCGGPAPVFSGERVIMTSGMMRRRRGFWLDRQDVTGGGWSGPTWAEFG